MNKSILWVFTFFALLAPSRGQETSAAPPLARLTPGDAWQVEILGEDERTAGEGRSKPREPGPKPEPIVIEKNILGPDFRMQILLDSSGSLALRRWLRGAHVFYPRDTADGFQMERIGAEMPGGPASPDRLLEFGWLNAKWRSGTAMIDGVECVIYRQPPGSPADEGDVPAEKLLAAIGRADGRPRRLENRSEIRRYVWHREPPPEFPAGAARILERFELERKAQLQRHNVPR